MTREDWARFEKLKNGNPDVQFALGARCEEQGHEYEYAMTAMFARYEECKWCGERKNYRAGIV